MSDVASLYYFIVGSSRPFAFVFYDSLRLRTVMDKSGGSLPLLYYCRYLASVLRLS